MRAEYQLTLPVPVDLAWTLLTDPAIALGCVPGLTTTRIGSESGEGTLRLRVRSTSATFAGSGQLTGRDDAAHGLTVQVEGVQVRGNGMLKADVEIAVASANGSGSVVTISTEFAVTGPLAESGGAAIEGAVNRLLTRFGANVLDALTVETGLPAADVAAPAIAGSVPPAPAAAPAPAPPSPPPVLPEPGFAPGRRTVAHPPAFDIDALPGRPGRLPVPSAAAIGRAVAVVVAAFGAVAALRRFRRR